MALTPNIGLADETKNKALASSYPEPNTALGEQLQPEEIESAQAIAEIIGQTLRRKYSDGSVRRDAHPKAHGCVRADFTVPQDLKLRFAKGVFQPGQTYPAWIRFSNGDENPNRADGEGDGRGMAIKLMDVKGDFIDAASAADGTHDFIMISHPVFLLDSPNDYVSLIRAVNAEGFFAGLLKPVKAALALGITGLRNTSATTSLKIDNPLNTRYWSMTPYGLGTGEGQEAVKFLARPCTQRPHDVPDDPDPNFLRAAMQDTLNRGPACMEFLMQPRTSPAMSVEDTQTEWEEAEAPFYTVARITIPKQVFDTKAQHEFCENLSFNPWHALKAHKPLGAVNRMRKAVYKAISGLRHEMNDAPSAEPKP